MTRSAQLGGKALEKEMTGPTLKTLVLTTNPFICISANLPYYELTKPPYRPCESETPGFGWLVLCRTVWLPIEEGGWLTCLPVSVGLFCGE